MPADRSRRADALVFETVGLQEPLQDWDAAAGCGISCRPLVKYTPRLLCSLQAVQVALARCLLAPLLKRLLQARALPGSARHADAFGLVVAPAQSLSSRLSPAYVPSYLAKSDCFVNRMTADLQQKQKIPQLSS